MLAAIAAEDLTKFLQVLDLWPGIPLATTYILLNKQARDTLYVP